jgi:hypothetical protein
MKLNQLTKHLEALVEITKFIKETPSFRVLNDLRDGHDAGGDDDDLFLDFSFEATRYYLHFNLAYAWKIHLIRDLDGANLRYIHSLKDFQKHFNLEPKPFWYDVNASDGRNDAQAVVWAHTEAEALKIAEECEGYGIGCRRLTQEEINDDENGFEFLLDPKEVKRIKKDKCYEYSSGT